MTATDTLTTLADTLLPLLGRTDNPALRERCAVIIQDLRFQAGWHTIHPHAALPVQLITRAEALVAKLRATRARRRPSYRAALSSDLSKLSRLLLLEAGSARTPRAACQFRYAARLLVQHARAVDAGADLDTGRAMFEAGRDMLRTRRADGRLTPQAPLRRAAA